MAYGPGAGARAMIDPRGRQGGGRKGKAVQTIHDKVRAEIREMGGRVFDTVCIIRNTGLPGCQARAAIDAALADGTIVREGEGFTATTPGTLPVFSRLMADTFG